MQVDYATDLTFRSTTTLGPLYEQLIRETVLSVKAEQVATLLGRQITPLLAQEIGSQLSTRIEGTCIKHRFGKCSIEMYDKHAMVLRTATTTNDVSFISPTSLPWTTSPPEFVRSAASPNRMTWMVEPSRGSASLNQGTVRYCMRCKIHGSTSLASAGATCCRSSACSFQSG